MNYKTGFKFVATGVSLFLLAVLSLGQDSASIPKAKRPYFLIGDEATLTGTVKLIGKRPEPKLIDTSSDPVCGEGTKTEWFEGEKDNLANVVVYVTSETLDGLSFKPPKSKANLEHRNCSYVPHVLAMQLGQTLVISNADSTAHNTHPNPRLNPQWNQTQPKGAPPIIRVPELAELAMPIRDNHHPWEKAYVSIFAHPFFAVTDRKGKFKIDGLPPGTYTLTAWHERLGEKTSELVLVPGESKDFSFDFEVPEKSQ